MAGMATAAQEKLNVLPDFVLAWPKMRQCGWLDSEEAATIMARRSRSRIRKQLTLEMAGESAPALSARGKPSLGLVDPNLTPKQLEDFRRCCRRGTAFGTAPCECRYCFAQGAKWPAPYVDQQPRSYECHLERNPPPEDEYKPPNRTHGERVSKREAKNAGLRERDPNQRSIWARTAEDHCEACGGCRPTGFRYCFGCAAEVKRLLSQAGWSDAKIMEYISPQEKFYTNG